MSAVAPTVAARPSDGRLRGVARGAGRDVAYLAPAFATSIVAGAIWIAAVSATVSLAVFVVGLPVFLLSAVAFRGVAELDRRNAGRRLGRPVRGGYRDHGGRGLLVRVGAVARDPQTWRDLSWLIVHSIVGFAFGVAAVCSIATTLGLLVAPAWFWSLPEGMDFGIWRVDTLGEAFAVVPLAIPCGAITVLLLRGMALGEAHIAAALLGGGDATAPTAAASPRRPRPRPTARSLRPALAAHAIVAAIVGSVCTLLWAVTGLGYFWPAWVWLGLSVPVGLHAFGIRAVTAPDRERAFRAKVELCADIAVFCVAVWALAGGGYLWPVWPVLGMGSVMAVRAVFVFRHRLPWVRERQLVQRVDELSRTRRGALDVQAAELRRIERDLHDGAQARLVSLSMLMGRAEEHLADRPDVADLVRRAREEAGEAIRELRDLARGIAPPVLTDRGLAAAVEALAVRAPMDVTVSVDAGDRPPPVVETAAYFVVAEALTNAAKHAAGAPARVTIARGGGVLTVEVADDGPGGAVAGGSGLTGLRHRVEALDGELTVDSPAGRGTTIRAELPCGS